MYVEISGRRTGKTTRLIKEVIKQVSYGKNCAIITPFNNMYIYRLLKDNLGSIDCEVDIESRKRIIVYSNVPIDNKSKGLIFRQTKLFYDEFAFIDPESIIIDTTGYYATTPNKTYTGIERMTPYKYSLLKVLEANKYQYAKYVITDDIFNELKASVTPMFFNREIKGEWN